MRGENYHQSTTEGLNVTSVHGDIFIPPDELQAFTDTNDIGKVDWVIVALKSSALDAIPPLIYPLLEPGKTRVLAIMNGMIEEDLIHLLKKHAGEDDDGKTLHCCAALYGGMALVCSNRLGPGRIDHSFAGLLSGGVAACCPNVTPEENQKAFEDLWRPAKVDIAYEPSILGGRWRKVCGQLPVLGKLQGFSVLLTTLYRSECMELAFQWNIRSNGRNHSRQDCRRPWIEAIGSPCYG
jgi:2-dehydropantoate 2-reductase